MRKTQRDLYSGEHQGKRAPGQKRFFPTWSLHSARDLSNEAVTTSLVLPVLSNERHRNGWSLRDTDYYNLH